MKYEEFEEYPQVTDKLNPFTNHYVEGDLSFYIEPAFYTQLQGFKMYHKADYPRIISRMKELIRKYKKIVFVGVFDTPQTEVDDSYIFLEITDVTDPLKIYAEDKSRGSDYGD